MYSFNYMRGGGGGGAAAASGYMVKDVAVEI
jgi:hypothetical protein